MVLRIRISFGALSRKSILIKPSEQKIGVGMAAPQKIPVDNLARVYGEGKSINQIADMFGFSYWMVRDRLLHYGVRIRNRNEPRLIPLESVKLTPEKAYVLGVVGLGDGYVSNKRIVLRATDLDFVLYFKNCLEKTYEHKCSFFLKPPHYTTILGRRCQAREMYEVRLNIRRAAHDLINYGKLSDFRHGTEHIPKRIKRSGLETQALYLRAFFDSQGSVSLHHREITGTKKNKLVLKEIGDLLSNFGVNWRTIGQTSSDCWDLIISDRRSIKKFAEKIGFTIGRKKQTLKELLNSYKTSRHQTPSKIVDSLVPEMKELRKVGYSYPKIGKSLKVNAKTVWRRLNKQREEA